MLEHSSQGPNIAIAILNYNGYVHLGKCLSSLQNQSYSNYEVYVIDNGSTDSSVTWITDYYPWVKLICFHENLGFSGAYNLAVKLLDFEYIVFLNNDTEVTENWLSELVKPMIQNKSIGICGSKILLMDEMETIAHAGGKLTFVGSGLDVGFKKFDSELKSSSEFVGFVCGASMLVRKSAFLDSHVDGFDQDYFAYHEDVDLCWRMWLHGYKVVYVPTSRLYHKSSGSWGSRFSFKRLFQSEKNRLINITKNFSFQLLFPSLLSSFCYVIFNFFIFLKKKNIFAIRAILKSHIHFIRTISITIHKRRKIQSNRVIDDSELVQLGLLANLSESIQEYLRIMRLAI